MSTYDSTGIVMDRYAEILEDLVVAAIAKWGESIDTSEEEYLGHMLRLISTGQGDVNEIVQDLYDALSIDNSTGAHLDNLVALVGLSRQAAAYSTATLTLTATGATTVPAGTLYKTAAGVQFAIDTEVIFVGSGTSDVTATCTVIGANEAAIGEINQIVTSITNISSVTNAAAAIPGAVRETDAELKEAHTIATATSGDDDLGSTYEACRAVSGNSACYVNENDKAHVVDSLPAHTIHVSVIGGSDEDIAAAINNNRTASVGTFGDESVTVYNSTTGQSKIVRFDRATTRRHYVDIDISTYTGIFPSDGESQIKENLVDHFDAFRIGQDTIFTALYKPIYTVPGVLVNSLYVGTSPGPTGTSDIENNPKQLASLDDDDISITSRPAT